MRYWAAFLVLAIVPLSGCHRCIREEEVTVPERVLMYPMWIGKMMIMMPQVVPEHKELECVEYEKK